MDATVAVARLNARLAVRAQNLEFAKATLGNPVVELLALFLIVEYAQRQGWLGSIAGTALETTGTAAVALQQLAPLAPYIAQGVSGLGGIIGKVAPIIGAAA